MKDSKYSEALVYALIWPILLGISWLLQSAGVWEVSQGGLYPRTLHGLLGIITAPFLHGDIHHWLGNTTALAVLSLFFYWKYPKLYIKTTLWVWLLGYGYTWLLARASYHIGASGIVYGYTFFLAGAGLYTRQMRDLAMSFLVIFLYGSAFWGIFPMTPGISWEAHLFGGLAGLFALWWYKNEVKDQAHPHDIQNDEDMDAMDESEDEDPYAALRSMEKKWPEP
jgi:membrane associated rhomboid family serine protease